MNRPSRAPETALEIQAGRQHHPAATLAADKIHACRSRRSVAGGSPDIWDSAGQEWGCAWLQIARIDRNIPSSWKLAALVTTAGASRYAVSVAAPRRRHQPVIFPANLVEGEEVAVHDPEHRLPHDQLSWP